MILFALIIGWALLTYWLCNVTLMRPWWSAFRPIYKARFNRPMRLYSFSAHFNFSLWRAGIQYSEPFPKPVTFLLISFLGMGCFFLLPIALLNFFAPTGSTQ